ncbi:MAG: DNA gyrase subunit A [Cytophagales bacterium]|jgi:DNA gyrase subunit A|nr:DNA gyrase subunit A [Cytophagales bacterium]
MDRSNSIIPIDIAKEMKSAYIDYSMSVIVSRALPDVRDGLKPVQRRILYGMNELNLAQNRTYKKSARIVGEVLGKYHPHGDSSVYEAMVRMAQTWSLRYPFIEGQGNFGSIDGDEPAAMRYTEARLRKCAEDMLDDLEKDTVDFRPNFDGSLEEPSVLPAKLPNLLINGCTGIAVGMATNIPPHNLGEIVDAIISFVDNFEISLDEVMQHVKGPDFPTGGIICGTSGIKEAYETGRGRIVVRSKTCIENSETGKSQIIVSEIPYMINKALLVERIAQLVNDKKIDGISEVRDESDKDGLRIVIDVKRDAAAQIVLNNLFANTALQSSFCVNSIALVNGKSKTLSLLEMIKCFYEHRHSVVIRRLNHELKLAKNKLHILEGFMKTIDNLDLVLNIVKNSDDSAKAMSLLFEKLDLTETQAKSILDLKLQRLTWMERNKIETDYQETSDLVKKISDTLIDDNSIKKIIKEELRIIKTRCNDKRRTDIQQDANDLSIIDVIPNEEVVITLSEQGYIKRTLLSEYRLQQRGGFGAKGAITKENDIITYVSIATTHQYLLAFTSRGEVYCKRVYEIPEGGKQSKGRAIQNIFPFSQYEQLKNIVCVDNLKDEDYINNHFIIFCTKKGIVKKTSLAQYANPRSTGIHAIVINEDDELVSIKLTDGDSYVIIAVRSGKSIRFHESKIRSMGRISTGVRGFYLNEGDEVVGMVTVKGGERDLLVVSEKGFGKRSKIDDYRITNRGGKGIKTLNITEKTGKLTSIEDVSDDEELIIINNAGIVIRMPIKGIRVLGRNTQGVTLVKLAKGNFITSVSKIKSDSDF